MCTTSAPAPSAGKEPFECSCSGLERRDPPRRTELGERNARKWLRRVGEHAEPRSRAREGVQCRARRRIATQIRRRVVLCEALQENPPVPGSRGVERRSRCGAIRRKRAGLHVEDGVCGGEPRRPQRACVPECVELDRDRTRLRHARRRARTDCQRTIPTATPTASIATSKGEPSRPGTNDWCTSSLIA